VLYRFDAETALTLLEAHPITHSQWVPTMFVRLLRLPEERRQAFKARAHRYAIHAAAPCPPAVKAAMIDWWGPILYEYYSATEANGQTVINSEEWLSHRGSVGRPLLGEVSIRDDDGKPCAPGERGGVYLRGGAPFRYLNDDAKTRAAYLDDGFSTVGDLGYLDEEGYLYLTDRRDFTIISGGVNIYPREIEDVLLADERVADAAVFGLPDEEFGERIHAAVELTTPAAPAEEAALGEALRQHCRRHLANLKCPKTWSFHQPLPRLPTGKLAKQTLRSAVLAAQGTPPAPPQEA
jgi:fatty-acyl-CoA synthase